MYRLSVHVFGQGERVPMLQDAHGIPLFYPTLFATAQLRNAGAAVNTIRNKLADILVLLRWEELQGRNLHEEFERGCWLSVADVASIRDFAKLDMRNLESGSRAKSSRDSSVIDFLEARVELSRAQSSIGGQQHYNRLTTIADYLEFLASVVVSRSRSQNTASEIAAMVKTIRKHRPRGMTSRFNDDLDYRSPPLDIVERFMSIGSEENSHNPFRTPSIRLRNAIIFGLLRHTGMRLGEMLSLRIDQIELGQEPRVWVRRNQDDSYDSRRYQPVAKTKERLLPLPAALADQIQRYIMQVRAKINPARRHPYLIVSHRRDKHWGRPLSVSAVNSKIFSRMRAVDPAFENMHPHAFRYNFNDQISIAIDDHNANAKLGSGKESLAPITESREQDVRAFLNGHRSKASSAVYIRRHIREVGANAVRKLQSELNNKGNSGGSEE